jgi:hypothetical protein
VQHGIRFPGVSGLGVFSVLLASRFSSLQFKITVASERSTMESEPSARSAHSRERSRRRRREKKSSEEEEENVGAETASKRARWADAVDLTGADDSEDKKEEREKKSTTDEQAGSTTRRTEFNSPSPQSPSAVGAASTLPPTALALSLDREDDLDSSPAIDTALLPHSYQHIIQLFPKVYSMASIFWHRGKDNYAASNRITLFA